MDANSKSKYPHWNTKSTTNTTNTTNTTHTTKPQSNFNFRFDPYKYSSTTRAQPSTNNTKSSLPSHTTANNNYSVDLNRLLHNDKNKKSSSSTSTTSPANIVPSTANITTRSHRTNQHNMRPTTSVPLTKLMHSKLRSNKQPIIDYHQERKTNDETHNIKHNTNDTKITDKFNKFNLKSSHQSNNNTNTRNNSNKYMLSSQSNNLLLNTNKDSSKRIANINKNTKISNRITDTQYNLSLIRPSDRVVLYSPIAHCYVCLSDFEDNDAIDGMYRGVGDGDYDDDDVKEENESDALYLKCDDMEGVALLIGETQFCGTCKFLADCKIQLITGQGLYKDGSRIIIHSKHTTKFMLQKYDNLGDTGSMGIGDRVLIFVEASRSNRKQFWSYDCETECIILKELSFEGKPTQNEMFLLQKYGQPLQIQTYKSLRDNANVDECADGYILDNFFGISGAHSSLQMQERYLCHDILRVLSRCDFNGDFITFTHDAVYGFPRIIFNGQKYGISPLLISAVDALKTIMEDTAIVRYFVSIHCRAEYGVLSQAFCGEIEKHLSDFNILLVQLETRLNRSELTLQNMRFYLQRASRSMNGLRRICCDIHLNKSRKSDKRMGRMERTDSKCNIYYGSRGGALLNMIVRHIDTCGQKHVRILYNKLLVAAQKPYFVMLSDWIYRGVITDIYNEFMIKEKPHLKKEDLCIEYNNEYWTGRYSLNHVQIPLILADYCDIIVTTGKYLNVLRESGYHDIIKCELHDLSECNSRQLGQYIADQYNFASKALLEMLMNRERIMDRFASIAKYMLLQSGDWFCYFMDMTQSILIKNAADIKKTKLDRLLELSFRTSCSSKNDPFKDDVCCDLKNCNLNQMMIMLHDIRSGAPAGLDHKNKGKGNKSGAPSTLNGLEAFALNYSVEWPASIVFTGRNLIRYQLIFRFLFKLKYVERQLKCAWKQQMSLRELNLYDTHNASLMLRHKMLSFIDSFLFYISYQVIERNWNKFIENTCFRIKTVDSLLSAQETFLTKTIQQCLFTDKSTIQLLFKILIGCDGYCNFIKRYTSDWKIYECTKGTKGNRSTAMDLLAKDCRDNLLSTSFINSITKYSKTFEEDVRAFLNNLQKINEENINVNVLLSLLDYNSYYIPKIVQL